jgi:RNA polymerase sigma-70 factor (ECF subfamily)
VAEDRLLDRAQLGDRAALEQLCQREWRAVYVIAYGALGNVAEAQDLTQETFLRALKSLHLFRNTGKPFSAWLATIARNLIRDGWRRRQHGSIDLEAAFDVASSETGPEDHAVASDEQQRLRAALASLPGDYQTVIRLRIFDGLPASDAARVMGRTPDAVRQLQHRALIALRGVLAEGSCA